MFNFRGSVIMNPIGAFNENHDGPKWEFVEHPDVAVNMQAATLSNAGFGANDKHIPETGFLGMKPILPMVLIVK